MARATASAEGNYVKMKDPEIPVLFNSVKHITSSLRANKLEKVYVEPSF